MVTISYLSICIDSKYGTLLVVFTDNFRLERALGLTRFLLNKRTQGGGLEVERLLHKLHDSTLVGSNPARCQKDFHSNSNTMGGE